MSERAKALVDVVLYALIVLPFAAWLVFALDVNVEDLGCLVLERAGDDSQAGTGFDRRARFDSQHFRAPFDAAFRNVNLHRPAHLGLLFFEPPNLRPRR